MAKRLGAVRAHSPRPTRLGEMLRLYRTVNRLSLRELATQIGTSHGTLLRIETGQEIEAGTMLRFWTWMLVEEQ